MFCNPTAAMATSVTELNKMIAEVEKITIKIPTVEDYLKIIQGLLPSNKQITIPTLPDFSVNTMFENVEEPETYSAFEIQMKNACGTAFPSLTGLAALLMLIKTIVTSLLSTIADWVITTVTKFITSLSNIWTSITGWWKNFREIVCGYCSSVWDKLMDNDVAVPVKSLLDVSKHGTISEKTKRKPFDTVKWQQRKNKLIKIMSDLIKPLMKLVDDIWEALKALYKLTESVSVTIWTAVKDTITCLNTWQECIQCLMGTVTRLKKT